jgi:serine/threonine-protein kinase
VLTVLDESIGPVPRVLLRDSPADDPRPVRPRSEEMPDLAGEPGRYQLIGEIARGGIGAVLKGRDVDLGRDLAIKVLLEEHRDHPEMVRRFVEEAQIGGQLQHPGIVPVYELGRFPDGRLYIAMKLVRGRTLAALMDSRKDPAEDRARFLSVFEQVCQTVAYAHARGVIHRDLKPSNVMVGNFGEVQVMDWGLAKVLDQGGVADEEKAHRSRGDKSAVRTLRSGSEAGESRAGSVLGTPAYMAPEQARGALDTLDERADVFGLGSILCEVLTGLPAFTGRTTAELYRKAERADLSDALERLDACGADGELVALARSCLAAAAKDRPRDAGVVLVGLTAYLAGVERRLRSAELAQAQAEAHAAGERKRRLLTLGLAASVLGSVLLGWGGWAWVAHERAGRAARTAAEVNKALGEAADWRGRARAAPAGDLAPWDKAVDAAKRAEALSKQGEAEAGLRDRARAVLAALDRERNEAHAEEKDHHMVERLAAIHDDLGVHQNPAKTDAEYAEAFRLYGVDVDALDPAEAGARLNASPVAAELANALDQWAFIRRGPGLQDWDGARRIVAMAKATDPDPWRNRLRDSLDTDAGDPKQARRTLVRLAETADPDRLPEASVTRLAFALSRPEPEMALSLLRRAQRAHPNDFWINCDLAGHLMRSGRPDEAARFFSVAVAVRPRSGFALNGLGSALHKSDRLDDAEATFRHVIRLLPDNATAHVGLGAVLTDWGKPEEAQAEFRNAKRLRPGEARVHIDIANLLASRGDWDAAIAENREAVRLEPRNAFAHDMLGLTLLDAGQADEAVEPIREAIRLDPRLIPAYGNLGRALLARGEFEAALEQFRRRHYRMVGSGPGSPSANPVREAERMVALDARLPALLRGEDKPADPAERAEFARLCSAKQLFATSARLWAEALAAHPGLDDDARADNRYRAAGAAAQAGYGRDRDDPPPDADARRRWRRQALDWLEADLGAAAKLLEGGPSRDRDALPKRLGRWRVDPALAGLRDESALSALPEPEREACRALWARVDALLEQARARVRSTAPIRPF